MKLSNFRLAPLCLILCAALVSAQTPPRPGSMTPNWPNTDISVIAEAVGAATGYNFIVPSTIRANVSFTMPAGSPPLNAQQLYAGFIAVLAQNGLAAVRSGNTVRIVQEAGARTMPGFDLPGTANVAPDDMVTDVLEAKNVNVLQLSQVLRSLVSQAGQLNPVTGTSFMLLTDRAGNVARIKKILARVDQSSNQDYQLIKLENAIASEVTKTISTLLQGQPADAGGGTVAPKVTADERTNSIIVSGDPAQRVRISDLADKLDEPVSTGSGSRVFALQYAKATDLATTLTAYVNGTTGSTSGSGAAGGAAAAPSVAAAADRNVKINAHETTNKLIITAPPRMMAQLEGIIQALDLPPDQVQIEAIVAEVTDKQAADLGVNWSLFSSDGNTNVPIAGFISPIAGADLGALAGAVSDIKSTISGGKLPQGGTFSGGRVNDTGNSFAVMLRALQTKGANNIVSLPNVTATNNQEAEMKSGQKVPFITGQYSNTLGGGGGGGGGIGGGGGGGSVNPFTTVNRQDVGTTLKVTPQIISATDEVILKIELTSSELSGTSGDAGSLITNERSVKTSVRARSGGIIVIGGMIKNDTDNTENAVPLLSKIPIIGELFRTRSGKREKTNMMVFIMPRILGDAIQANAATSAKYDPIRDEVERQNGNRGILPSSPNKAATPMPEMPALPNPSAKPATPAKP